MYFGYFINISLWKRAWPLIWKNLNPLNSRMYLCQIWLIYAQFFWRRRFLNFINVFSLFRNYLPLEKDVAFIWTILNHRSSPKYALFQVKLKLAEWFWRRRVLNFVNVFFAISSLSPLGKGRGPLLEQTWIPFSKGFFVPSLVEISPMVLEKMKMWKVYWQMAWQMTDAKQSEKLMSFSSGELKMLGKFNLTCYAAFTFEYQVWIYMVLKITGIIYFNFWHGSNYLASALCVHPSLLKRNILWVI